MAKKTLNFDSARVLNALYCNKEDNLRRVEKALEVEITSRDNWLTMEGSEAAVEKTEALFETLKLAKKQGLHIGESDFDHILLGVKEGKIEELNETYDNPLKMTIRNKTIVPKTINQKKYLSFIEKYDVVLGIGPAGTGKTYLAVASALKALFENRVKRVIITRPAVEAGEALGFLPGDLREKILPYLRPIYDAMYDILGHDEATQLLEKEVVEIAPLAYMRGRTLSNAFVILDEAQNTTPMQMLMFLTRLGESSKMVVTGDITQVDLPKSTTSGLKQAAKVLKDVGGIKLFFFEAKDVVRHPLVQAIIDAYEHYSGENG